MKKATVVILITLLAFGFLASAAEKTKVPLSAIKSTCYNEIDMTKAEFLLSEVGKECVTKDWLEANLPQTSAEETTTKDKPTKNLAEKLEDTQEWVIEPGEKVVLEDISMDIPTDFIIKEGGRLVIRNCDLYMLGQDHHDNYIRVKGSLTIEESHIEGEPFIGPYIKSLNPDATIEVKNSTLGNEQLMEEKNLGAVHVSLLNGGTVNLDDVGFLANLSLWQSENAMQEKGIVHAQDTDIDTLTLFLGNTSGEYRFEGLKPNTENFSFSEGEMKLSIQNCHIDSTGIVNNGSQGEGKLRLHIVDSNIFSVTAWEGGDVILENTDICGLSIKNRNYHEYFDLPKNGDFSDRVLVDEPNRKVRLIDSSIGDYNPHCPTGRFGIEVKGMMAGVKIVDSDLAKLTVGKDLEARNVSTDNLLIYDSSGNLHFENTEIGYLNLSISINSTISGELKIRQKKLSDWGGLKQLSLTRKFPVKLLDENGERVANKNIELLNPDREKVDTVTTNSTGEAGVVVNFNKSNLRDTWTLQVPSLELSQPVEVLSDTPVILSENR